MVLKKKVSARKTTFSQLEICYKSKRVGTFDQLKISEKNAPSQKKHQQRMMKY